MTKSITSGFGKRNRRRMANKELTWHDWYGYQKRVDVNEQDDSRYIDIHESSETKGH